MDGWGPVFYILAWVAVGLLLTSSTSIRRQDRRFGYMLNQLSEGRHVHPSEFDTIEARAQRAITAKPHLARIAALTLSAACVCVVLGVFLFATVFLVVAGVAYVGVRRADWLLHHESKWKIDE